MKQINRLHAKSRDRRKYHYVDKIPISENGRIVEMYKSGLSIIQIASKYKCSLSLISDRLDNAGIHRRESTFIGTSLSPNFDDCNPPESCFVCTFPDCMQSGKQTPKEKEFIKGVMK